MLVWCPWLNCRILDSGHHVLSFFVALTAPVTPVANEDEEDDVGNDDDDNVLATAIISNN